MYVDKRWGRMRYLNKSIFYKLRVNSFRRWSYLLVEGLENSGAKLLTPWGGRTRSTLQGAYHRLCQFEFSKGEKNIAQCQKGGFNKGSFWTYLSSSVLVPKSSSKGWRAMDQDIFDLSLVKKRGNLKINFINDRYREKWEEFYTIHIGRD